GASGGAWGSPIDQFRAWEGGGSGKVVVRLASGQEVRFGQNQDAGHTSSAPPGINLTLTRLAAPALWVVREAGGRLTYFNDSGRLDRVVDPDGRTQTYMYAADGTLARITDVYSGRILDLRRAGGHARRVYTD